MGSVGPMDLIFLLITVAVIAAVCGYVTSASERRNKRSARQFFMAGFGCGLVAGIVVKKRRQGLRLLGGLGRRVALLSPAAIGRNLDFRRRLN